MERSETKYVEGLRNAVGYLKDFICLLERFTRLKRVSSSERVFRSNLGPSDAYELKVAQADIGVFLGKVRDETAHLFGESADIVELIEAIISPINKFSVSRSMSGGWEPMPYVFEGCLDLELLRGKIARLEVWHEQGEYYLVEKSN